MVQQVQGRYPASERAAGRMLGFERTALRYVPKRPMRDAALCDKLRALAATYTRWGVPRLHWKLQRDGWRVNYKRVERLYSLEGLVRISLHPDPPFRSKSITRFARSRSPVSADGDHAVT